MATLQNHLENLRAKPEHVRERYAFWGSLGITAIIAAFWLSSFTVALSSPQTSVNAAVASAGTPGASLVAGVESFFGDIKDFIFGAKKVTYTSIEVSPGK